jgi:hypothetical protein
MTKDPTKDPEFQKVVQTFLHTKPQPRKDKKAAKKTEAQITEVGAAWLQRQRIVNGRPERF